MNRELATLRPQVQRRGPSWFRSEVQTPHFVALSRRLEHLAAVLGAGLALVLWPTSTRGQEIRLGTSAAFTGPSASLGCELYRGASAYFEKVNNSGGIHGRRIRIVALDDCYTPGKAISNTVRLIHEDKVDLLFNYVGTPTVTVVLPLLKKYQNEHFFLFGAFTGAQSLRAPPYGSYVFNLRASYEQETAALVDYFVAQGLRRVAVFYQCDAFGRSGWHGICAQLRTHGLEIVAEATYTRGISFKESMAKQVEHLRQANADVVMCIGVYAPCAAFIRDARLAGWDVPISNISFVGANHLHSLLAECEKQQSRTLTANLICSQVVPSYEEDSLPAVREYAELMALYNPQVPAELLDPDYKPDARSFAGLEGFLNAKLLVEALRRLPDFRKELLPGAFDSLTDFDLGIEAPLHFGPGRHQGLDRVYLTRLSGGRFLPIPNPSGKQK